MWNYVYLNRGLTINFNGQRFVSKNGLLDLLNNNIEGEALYEPIGLREDDFEFALVHTNRRYGEEYYSFVNGQYTTQGGTHQQAFREAIVQTIREYFKKDFDPNDVRNSIVAAISIKVRGPIFESQTWSSSVCVSYWYKAQEEYPSNMPRELWATSNTAACVTSFL